MTTIRKFGYATLLALTTFSFMPTLASAEGPARGEFTLTHEVHWQNALVPAGEYRFTYESDGAAGLLTLSKLNGPRTGFMFLVSDTDAANPSGANRLEIETTPDGSFVSAMLLSESRMTLHFAVPAAKIASSRPTVASAAK